MKSIFTPSLSPELTEIQKQCQDIINQHPSTAAMIVVVFRDKAGKTLSLEVPNQEALLEKLPAGGVYFTGINS